MFDVCCLFIRVYSSSVDWWRREFVGEYLPMVWKTEPSFVNYLKGAGIYKVAGPNHIEAVSRMPSFMQIIIIIIKIIIISV